MEMWEERQNKGDRRVLFRMVVRSNGEMEDKIMMSQGCVELKGAEAKL